MSFSSDTLTFTDEDLNQFKKASDVKNKPSGENNPGKTNVLPANGVHLQKQKSFEVRYTGYGRNTRRVIITVRFNDSVDAPMLLDTGAYGTLISYELADKLRLFDKNNAGLKTRVGGIGGTTKAIVTIIDTVQVGNGRDSFLPVTVSEFRSGGQAEGLIGMDFMANHSVKVDAKRHVVVFEELPPQGVMPGGHDEEWWRNNFRQFAAMRSAYSDAKKNLIEIDKNNAHNPTENLSEVEISERKKYYDSQYIEAEKLFDKLNGYATRNSVPMNWREY